MKDLVSVRRLRWLGHMARMGDMIPKKLLFGWLPQTRLRQDLRRFSIPESD